MMNCKIISKEALVANSKAQSNGVFFQKFEDRRNSTNVDVKDAVTFHGRIYKTNCTHRISNVGNEMRWIYLLHLSAFLNKCNSFHTT
jgi:hypothetical protein